MQRRLTTIFLFFIFGLFSLAVKARADTVVITGGGAYQNNGGHTFDFIGQGFRVSGSGDFGLLPCSVAPCTTSSVITIFDRFSGLSDLKSGPATFNGTDYQQLFYSGAVVFSTDPFILPADSPTGYFTVAVPFTMTGHLDSYLLNPFARDPGPAVFSVDVSGEGIAYLDLFGFDTPGGRKFDGYRTRYAFQSTIPTPEPPTLFLLGTGVAGVAVKGYRRRKRREQS